MHKAQIWKSIEALRDEAETVAQSPVPIIAVIKSTSPRAISQRLNAPEPKATVTQNETVILKAKPSPPLVCLEVRSSLYERRQSYKDSDGPLTPATMADIAAAIEQISKAPNNPQALLKDQDSRNETRHQMIGEISEAVRVVLINELPKLIRHAVSDSLYELLKTAPPTQVPAHGELTTSDQNATTTNKRVLEKATEKKSSSQKTRSTKSLNSQPDTRKVRLNTPTAKKAVSTNTTKKRQ